MIIKTVFAATLKPPGVDPTLEPVFKLESIISTVISLLTVAAVIYFVFQIIIAGYTFISSEGDKNKIDAARKSLTYSVLGLVLVIVSVGIASLVASLLGLGNVFNLQNIFKTLSEQE
ncbi:MAG: hypothetical protein ACOX6N_04210 [Patescibacteria group bacterium]|jgi:phosphoglycerol transferase MdoB-like AlkP superfamily enzyme